MKILRKDDDFVKMPDHSIEDIKRINTMIERGWSFSPKKDYKPSKNEKIDDTSSDEVKKEKKAKKEKKEVKDKVKKGKK